MSEVAGRLSVQEGAYYLAKAHGGRGILLAGVPGRAARQRGDLGAGTVGLNAARSPLGLGADVSILDINLDRLRARRRPLPRPGRHAGVEQPSTSPRLPRRADLLVGAVLVAGARAPVLVTEGDGGDDEGGLGDRRRRGGPGRHASRRSTRPRCSSPIYLVYGVVHYGVANMPALVPRTSTFALTNATLPYVLELAAKGGGGAAARTRAGQGRERLARPHRAPGGGAGRRRAATPLEAVLAE